MSPHPWLHRTVRNRERDRRIARRLPMFLIEYPLESLLSAWGVFSGIQVVISMSRPSTSSLPHPLPLIWGAMLLVGSLYCMWGLYRHAYETWVASGMALFGWTSAIYAVAVIAYSPDPRRSGTVAGLLLAIAIICFARGWFLRARESLLIEHAERSEPA